MSINKTTAAGAAIVAVAAGTFLLATATSTNAAPPSKTPSAPILVDANSVVVSGVVDIPGGTSVIRLVDGGLWRYSTLGAFQGATGTGTVAFSDASCTTPVLTNSPLGSDPLTHAPVVMNAVVQRTAYVATSGIQQNGEVYVEFGGSCDLFEANVGGSDSLVNYYPAKKIQPPANLPGPLAFK